MIAKFNSKPWLYGGFGNLVDGVHQKLSYNVSMFCYVLTRENAQIMKLTWDNQTPVSTNPKTTSMSTTLNNALDRHTGRCWWQAHTRTCTHTHRALLYFDQCIWHYWHWTQSTSSLCSRIMAPLWRWISLYILHRCEAAAVLGTSMKWNQASQTVHGGHDKAR